MKRFLFVLTGLKSMAALFFTACVMIYTVIDTLSYGGSALPYSVIIQMALISLIGSILQFCAFSDILFKKLRYSLRLSVFAFALFALMSAFAIVFAWFPASPINWLLFFIISMIVVSVSTTVYEIYFRITGKKLNASLDAYKAKNA